MRCDPGWSRTSNEEADVGVKYDTQKVKTLEVRCVQRPNKVIPVEEKTNAMYEVEYEARQGQDERMRERGSLGKLDQSRH